MDTEGVPIHVLAQYFTFLSEFIRGHFEIHSLSLYKFLHFPFFSPSLSSPHFPFHFPKSRENIYFLKTNFSGGKKKGKKKKRLNFENAFLFHCKNHDHLSVQGDPKIKAQEHLVPEREATGHDNGALLLALGEGPSEHHQNLCNMTLKG